MIKPVKVATKWIMRKRSIPFLFRIWIGSIHSNEKIFKSSIKNTKYHLMSDPIINSLVQSPLVRTLNNVPGKSSNFLYGIEDNVPPFSYDHVVVDRYAGSDSSTVDKFRVPQNGYLDQVFVKVMIDRIAAQPGVDSGLWNVTKVIDSVQLMSHNKVLNTVYSETTAFDVERMVDNGTSYKLAEGMKGYTGYVANGTTGATTIDAITHFGKIQPFDATAAGETTAVFYLPVPFSTTLSPHVNLPTRFVEDLQIWVNKKLVAVSDLGLAVAGVRTQLLLRYHTFHDTIENNIRNSNFVRGVPATLLLRDYVDETSIAKSDTKVVVKLLSNHVVSKIYFVLSSTSNASATSVKFGIASLVNTPSLVTLTANGRTLYSREFASLFMDEIPMALNTYNSHPTSVSKGVTDYGFVLDFTMDGNPLINTGGIALESLTDPTLTVSWSTAGLANKYVRCYVEYKHLLRIDSDTGVITRGIDS